MRRFYIPILLIFALPVVAPALSQEAIQVQDGSELYAQRCAECHGARAISAWGRKMPDETQRREWLDGLLKTHYPPPEAERAHIIEHIQSQIAGR